MENPNPVRGMKVFLICFFLTMLCATICVSARPDKEIRERFYGSLAGESSAPDSGEGSIAKMFDRVLEKEFTEGDQPEGRQFILIEFSAFFFFALILILLFGVWMFGQSNCFGECGRK